jgi:hypothetical protein
LVLKDPGGELLSGLLGKPMDVERFLGLAIGVAATLGKAHRCGLIHRDCRNRYRPFWSRKVTLRIELSVKYR